MEAETKAETRVEVATKEVSVAKDAVQRVARRSVRLEKQTFQQRDSEVETTLQREVKGFLMLGLLAKVEDSFNTVGADDRYFDWYYVLDGIGRGALTHALRKMNILEAEHCTRHAFDEYRDEHEAEELWEDMSLAMCMTAEVLNQLYEGIRHADERWPQAICRFIHYATDVAVVHYTIRMGMDLPDHVRVRCEADRSVTVVEQDYDIMTGV